MSDRLRTYKKATSNLVSKKAKAAIALAFVGGLNHCCTPAIGDDKIQRVPPTLKFPAGSSTARQSPEQRSRQAEFHAYRLLLRAEAYLKNDDRKMVETQFPDEPDVSTNFRLRLNDILLRWEERLASENEFSKNTQDANELTPVHVSKTRPSKNDDIAIETVNKALVELKSASDQGRKLNMYFIASLLLEKAGNKKGFQKCNEVIEEYIRSCETSQLVDEEQILAAVSILNSKSREIVAVEIPYYHQNFWTSGGHLSLPEKPFTEEQLAKSEALWLRSAALADRLKPTANTRRMVHRDLSIWYKLVGKSDEAEQQKQILFNLIGRKDDKLLYPTAGICGALIWWSDAPKNIHAMLCGMG